MDWKEKLDETIKEYLNELLEKTMEYRKAYLSSRDVKISQLWVALAILYRELSLLKKEISRESGEKVEKGEENKKKKQEKEKIKIKELIRSLEEF